MPERLDAIPGSEAEFAIIKRACRLMAASEAARPAPVFCLSARAPTAPATTLSASAVESSVRGVHTSVAIAKLRRAKRSAELVTGAGLGPRKGTLEVGSAYFGGTLDLDDWRRRARHEMILGSAPKSHREAISALNAWQNFANGILGLGSRPQLPPRAADLLEWSALFSSPKVFRNYLAKLKLACHICDLPVHVFDDPLVAKAKSTLKARASKSVAPWHMLRAEGLVRLMRHATSAGDERFSMLCLAAYTFSLRIPSEALQLCVGMPEDALRDLPAGHHSCISRCGSLLVLRLATRKNRQGIASKLARACSCRGLRELCPVHVLAPWLHRQTSARPFAVWTPNAFLKRLRSSLASAGIDHAAEFNTKCFRRGHTQDLAVFGGSAAAVRASGQWSSRRGMQAYLDEEALENAAANTAARMPRSRSDVYRGGEK